MAKPSMVCTWVKPAGQHPAWVVGGLGGGEVNVSLYWVKHSQHWQGAAMALKPSHTVIVQNQIILVKQFLMEHNFSGSLLASLSILISLTIFILNCKSVRYTMYFWN